MAVNGEFDFLIQWHLTERCNLHCMHCYQNGTTPEEIRLEEIISGFGEIFDTIKEWADLYEITFSPSVNLTGGEPFLFRDLFVILEYLAGHSVETYLLTNGILVNREKAVMLSECGVNGMQISIEGPQDIHDAIRGEGSFSKSLKGAEHLLKAGLEVTFNTTLSELNAGRFEEIIEISRSVGVQRLGFSRLVPSGQGLGMLHHMLPARKIRDLYQRLQRINLDGLVIVTGDPVAAQCLIQPTGNDDIPLGGCAAGVSGITVLPDGSLLPCRRLPIRLGNIREDSFREIWATSPVLINLRNKGIYGGRCGTCERWSSCRGCRAIAYAHAQSRGLEDYLNEDPQCFIKG